MVFDSKESLRTYLTNTHHYLDNAFRALDAGEVDKAGEFIWGSMAAAIKAVAALKGTHLRRHRDIWDFAKALAKEMNSKTIFDDFVKANSLHSNFYESGLQREDVLLFAEDIRRTIGQLLRLIPSEVASQLGDS